MSRCNKCDIEVDTKGTHCPLCNARIEKTASPTYPIIKTMSTWQFIKRILLIVVISISVLVIFLNRILTPLTKWSVFVIAALWTMYVIFLGVMKGHKRILSMMFYMSFLIIMITNLWDNLVGDYGWSLNYVLPSVAISYGIFLIALRFVSHFAIEDNSMYIYLHIFLEFLPMVLYVKKIVTFAPLAVISAFFGIVNLLVLIVFDFTHLKKDLAMRLHI